MRRLLFFALTCYSSYSHAQFLLDTVHIDQVDVSARRPLAELGLVSTTIDSIAMSRASSQNLGELLSTHSPLYIKSYGGSSMATASFRGTASSHTQVVWNGITINAASNGISDLALLPGAFTDQLTLLHGGSSLTNGSGALGGTILLDNKPQWDKPLRVSASAGSGSFGMRKYLASAGAGQQRWQYKIKVLHDAADNDYIFRNDEVLPSRIDTMHHAGYLKQGIIQELYLKTSGQSVLSAQHWMTAAERDLPPLMSYEGTNAEHQDDRAHRGSVKWQQYAAAWHISLRTGYNSTHSAYQNKSQMRDWLISNVATEESLYFASAEAKRNIAEGRGCIRYTAGVSHGLVRSDNTVMNTGYHRNRTEYDAGVSFHWRISERMGSYALVRAEYYDRTAAPLTPSAGLDYIVLPGKDLVATVSATRNYHKPSLNDLYYLPGGNPDLLPEDGFSADASLNYARKGTRIGTTMRSNVYLSRISNWIVWEPTHSGASYHEAANLKEVLARGCENMLSAYISTGHYHISLRATYTYTRTENIHPRSDTDLSAGKQLMYIPVHSGGASAECRRGIVTAGIASHYTGERFTTSSNTTNYTVYQHTLPGYWLSSAFASIQIERLRHRWTGRLQADNVLNTDYKAVLGRPMPQRSFYLSIGWQWEA